MIDTTPLTPLPRVPSTAMWVFFGLTFAITWGVVGIYILWPVWASSKFGEISGTHPFFFLATWAPAISAFTLVLYFSGLPGLRAFLSRLFLWRCAPGWVGFILIGIPVVYMMGSLLKGGSVLAPLPPEGTSGLIAVLFMMLFLGPIEEFGWRGIAQPILQRHVAPVWAGAFIGTIWGIWHVPAFFLSGTVFGNWNFLPFLIGNITLAVLVTPIFNRSGGSLLWPVLFHWQLINPFWPDAQPYDTWILVGVTLFVVWWNRDTMFSKNGAVTSVIPVSVSHRISS
ncbi:CPBP family intramembrane glutamic endopeptidase [Shimia sp.]|uniref:CPBP family intramembrane glutamic endopeptidase n=1 Tax=Shimia sp. TaxID=1954381 RepID=UPI0032996415